MMMPNKLLSLLALVVALGFPGGPAAAQQHDGTEVGDVARGAKAYGATCGRCHNSRSPVERTDAEWLVIVNHMRMRAGLDGQQARDILAFLQAMNHEESAVFPVPTPSVSAAGEPTDAGVGSVSTDPADIARGGALTAEKGCIGCHVIDGGGGQIGPSLDRVVSAKGAEFVFRKLADPSFNNGGTLMPNLGLSADEIQALVAYLASLSEKAALLDGASEVPSREGGGD